MTAADPGVCGVRWCDETLDHDGPHRRPLLDTHGLDVATGRPTIVQVWLSGESARTRGLVVVTGGCETGFTWPQAGQLAAALATARKRYATQ